MDQKDLPDNVRYLSDGKLDWGKWPMIIVSGDKVTKDQAKEIIVRTETFRYKSEDFGNAVLDAFNIPKYNKEESFFSYHNNFEKRLKEFKNLDLTYLFNSMMSYTNQKGWCHWDGTIAASYCVGKHPSFEKITEELSQIAKAFSFLNMRVCFAVKNEDLLEIATCYKITNGEVEITNGEDDLDILSNPLPETTLNSWQKEIKRITLVGKEGLSIDDYFNSKEHEDFLEKQKSETAHLLDYIKGLAKEFDNV